MNWPCETGLFSNIYQALSSSAPARPLPHRSMRPCRRIVFRISSHDQGWANGGVSGYHGSCTWFDAMVVRDAYKKIRALTADGNPEDNADSIEEPSFPTNYGGLSSYALQMNKAAELNTEQYTIIWDYRDDMHPDCAQAQEIQEQQGRGRFTLDGNTVRQLQVGDAISVWGRARFGEWSNYVEWCSVRVFWAV